MTNGDGEQQELSTRPRTQEKVWTGKGKGTKRLYFERFGWSASDIRVCTAYRIRVVDRELMSKWPRLGRAFTISN
jgi:hypothetical protein